MPLYKLGPRCPSDAKVEFEYKEYEGQEAMTAIICLPADVLGDQDQH